MQGNPMLQNDGRQGLKAMLEEYEKTLILQALEASGGHQRRTAARLGILPTTLHEKMKRLGLLRSRAKGVPGVMDADAPMAAAMAAGPFGSRRPS
jgi:DNA-binding NtrC family response regulator